MPAGRPKLCRCAKPQWNLRAAGVYRCNTCNGAPGTARVAEARAAVDALMKAKEDEVRVTATSRPLDAPVEAPAEKSLWSPDKDDFILLKGKAYLPARRRIQWMRAEHPDWTIKTRVMHFVPATRTGTKVTGGMAVVKATVCDETGRTISQGTKSETSENFPDFLEKAETGAIARALAVAGYGTEMALDLDEGLEKERIADAPVELPAVTIGPSKVAGIGKGGRSAGSTVAQLKRVAELSGSRGLGVDGLTELIESLGYDVDLMQYGEGVEKAYAMRMWLSDQSSDTVATIINVLSIGEGETSA